MRAAQCRDGLSLHPQPSSRRIGLPGAASQSKPCPETRSDDQGHVEIGEGIAHPAGGVRMNRTARLMDCSGTMLTSATHPPSSSIPGPRNPSPRIPRSRPSSEPTWESARSHSAGRIFRRTSSLFGIRGSRTCDGIKQALHRRFHDQQFPALDDPHVGPLLMLNLALGVSCPLIEIPIAWIPSPRWATSGNGSLPGQPEQSIPCIPVSSCQNVR